MSVLITGGCGYIGSHCALTLLRAGYNVVLLDNLSTGSTKRVTALEQLANKPLVVHVADINQKHQLRSVFQAQPIQAVIHCAGVKSVGESRTTPLKYYSNNVAGLINVLEVMQEYGISRLVFSSSATVYTESNEVLTETSPTAGLQAKSVYGITKCINERILEDVCTTGRFHCVCLRYFNPIGHIHGLMADTSPSNLLPRIKEVLDNKEALPIYGTDYDTLDGTAIRDYIHIQDLAQGHLSALEFLTSMSGYRVFNLGTGVGFSVKEIIQSVRDIGKNLETVEVPRRDGDVAKLVADSTLAREVLGWQAMYTLEDMLKSCLDSKL